MLVKTGFSQANLIVGGLVSGNDDLAVFQNCIVYIMRREMQERDLTGLNWFKPGGSAGFVT